MQRGVLFKHHHSRVWVAVDPSARATMVQELGNEVVVTAGGSAVKVHGSFDETLAKLGLIVIDKAPEGN